jgi:hypothetical protein
MLAPSQSGPQAVASAEPKVPYLRLVKPASVPAPPDPAPRPHDRFWLGWIHAFWRLGFALIALVTPRD